MNKGFSLVELIVVIAIMAILVGVAVPVYTSYIKEAEDAVDQQYIESMESALNTAWIDAQAGLTDATNTVKLDAAAAITVTVTSNGTTVSVTVTEGSDEKENTILEELFVKMIDLDAKNTNSYTFVKAANSNTFAAQ
jgi:type IV pilus assembly protein PilA